MHMHAYGVVYNTQADPTVQTSAACGTRGLVAGTGEQCFNRLQGLGSSTLQCQDKGSLSQDNLPLVSILTCACIGFLHI